MRALPIVVVAVASMVACSGEDEPASPPPSTTNEPPPVRDSGSGSSSGGNDGPSPNDDATPGNDGGAAEAGAPAVQLVGRFDMTNATAPKVAWPGSRIIARFSGTGVKATLTHANGLDGGNTWMNVVVDGVVKTPIEVTGASQMFTLATGLAPGDHVVELQKRTEPNVGTVTFEGFTFEGNGQLLAPPARPARRIEFLSDSTIDGYGVDGNRNATCTGGTAPVQFNDARKSLAFFTAEALSAEHHLVAYSGKGVARNEDGTTADLFGAIFPKTLPEAPTSPWAFNSWTPDVVVVSLGGSDFAQGGKPAGFDAAYKALVADVRAKYGAGPRIVLLVWSQLKEYNGVRQAITATIDATIGTDPKISRFTLPEADVNTDETGCQYHANAAHHQAMATLLAAEIKSKMGW